MRGSRPGLVVVNLSCGSTDPSFPTGTDLTAEKAASAFFGTNLSAILAAQGVDTVMVCGATTSGCVVDSVRYGFQTLAVRDCVGDRAQGPHEANLFDMAATYADVIHLAEALDYIAGVPDPASAPVGS